MFVLTRFVLVLFILICYNGSYKREKYYYMSNISIWLNNNRNVVRHVTPVTMSKWIRGWSGSTEYS